MSGVAQAMILAAGRGERMRPLTDHCPKPLLELRGKPMIQYQMEALERSGYRDLVINTAWLGEQIEDRFPSSDDLRIRYSSEGRDFGGAVETAGGIARALPLLHDVFWIVAADVFSPRFEFSREAMRRFAATDALAHLILVRNPDHNPNGDFGLRPDGVALNLAEVRFTYSTIGLYRKEFFSSLPAGNPRGLKAPLAPLLRAAVDNGRVTAELYTGPWTDVGTPERLAQLNAP